MNNPDPQILAFTLVPDPKRYKSTQPYDQYKSLLTCIFGRKKLMLKTFSEFLFYPELTLNGNVHLHGFYKVKNKLSYFKWFLPACKQWGNTLVKFRVDDGWLAYVMKETEDDYMESLFEGLPYPLDEDSIETYKHDDFKAKHTISTKKYNIMKYIMKK